VVASAIVVGAGPMAVAINPAGTRAYVTNFAASTVSIIDTSTNLVVGSPVNVGANPAGAAVNPQGTKIYVANQSSNTISVIDAVTTAVSTTISAGLGTGPVALGNFIENVPVVISTTPASGATTVSTNTLITATFSKDMDATTITAGTFTVSGVAGAVSYNATTRTATFTPSTTLSDSITYTATVTTGVKDTKGNSLASDFTWTFTTTSGTSTSSCFIATAAYGSPLDRHVSVLRKFRDRHLLTNPAGEMFCRFYSLYSPSIANVIRHHESLRTLTRWTLTPVIWAIECPLLLASIVFTGAVTGFCWRRKLRQL
jgi:YVTN family beta-propeller protein